MKKQFPYSTFLNGFIYFILIGQLWVSTVDYCYWMIDSDTEFVELNNSEDNESEEENESKEKKEKTRSNPFYNNYILVNFNLNRFSFQNFKSIHQPDVTTPPPKFSINS